MMGNVVWFDNFQDFAAQFTPPPPDFSDHSAGVLHSLLPSQRKSSPFKFFYFLTRHKEFQKVIQSSWSSSSHVYETQMVPIEQEIESFERPFEIIK